MDGLSQMLEKGVKDGFLPRFSISGDNLLISHLQFADDTTIFSINVKSKLNNFKELVF